MKTIILHVFLFFGIMAVAQNASFEVAKEHYDKGNYTKAKNEINALLDSDKTTRVWFLRTSIYAALLREGSIESTRSELIKEIALSMNKTKELEKEGTSYYTLTHQKLESLWSDELNKGVENYRAKSYEKAYEYYKNALMFKPEHPENLLYLAYTAQQLKGYQEAIATYEKLIKMDKVDDVSYSFYLLCQEENGATNDQFERLLQMGLDSYPGSKVLQEKKIKHLSKQRKYNELEIYLRELVKRNPTDEGYLLQQALNYEDIYHNNYERGNSLAANDYYEKARNTYLKVVSSKD
ncbi:MAG: hypothetical protein HRT68_09065, partial [Flavobacteriaceae bacterium]|nr:hypothetical protein [Flavobacteriaceae bacterium]